MSREGGDWMCQACQHINFKKREACQRCGCPKYAAPAEVAAYAAAQRTEVMAGDWYCAGMNCGAHNYASRSTCYRCGGVKTYCGYGAGVMSPAGYGYDGAVPGWKTGDWICNQCAMHNYASRMECYKCKTPREKGNLGNWNE